MAQKGCEQIALLLSKYADGEATPDELKAVNSHVAACAECSRKLAEYNELAAIFSATPKRDAEPQLRVNVFRELDRIHREEARRPREASRLPLPVGTVPRSSRALSRMWLAVSPFVVASAAVFTIIGLALFLGKERVPTKPDDSTVAIDYPPVPTIASMVMVGPDDTGGLVPVSTKLAGVMSPIVAASATASSEGMAASSLPLFQPTPLFESGNVRSINSWHTIKDPTVGYTVSYPPNWWTYVSGASRYFVPGGQNDLSAAAYWVDMRVQPNTLGLTTENANARQFGGRATVIRNSSGSAMWVRHTSDDASARYDEVYSFDANNMYVLRLGVSKTAGPDTLNARWQQGEDLFSRMSGTFSPTAAQASAQMGYAPVLFLNGTDLYMIEPNGLSRAVTRGYGVRQYALSPDMKTVAFTSARNSSDIWASYLYLVHIDGDTVGTPVAVWQGSTEVHDIAWYGDRQLLFIGASAAEALGLFSLAVSPGGPTASGSSAARIVDLDSETMAGARGLSVSTDRQLITFLAPLGESKGTDLYSVRPDGSDFGVLISHADPVSPTDENGKVFSADSQAIKSYQWTDLQTPGQYGFRLLLTCGNAASPTFYRGGFLYSSPSSLSSTLLNQAALGVVNSSKVQIVHLAYAAGGKLAFTGYYFDYNGRADMLAGLWTGTLSANGALTNLHAQPSPEGNHGITDLQWSPDGRSLIYRETVPQDPDSLSSRYTGSGQSAFSLVKLDPTTGRSVTLYSSK